MGTAYTPGLRVTARARVRRERTLPLEGEVRVAKGAAVAAADVVAETALPGDVHGVNVVNRLGITAQEIKRYMLKQEGDAVAKGEPIALSRSLFGLLRTEVPSPIDGSVERISEVTGQVLLRTPPKPVQVRAFLDGTVAEVRPGQGVVVEALATHIQGIFGVGLETWGELAIAVDSPAEELTPSRIRDDHRGKLLVGGSLVRCAAIDRAREVGVRGIIAGGIRDEDLKRLLGYDLGVAITGQEDLGVTIVVTEGFGAIDMAGRTFELLSSRAGAHASLSAATQIRAGVMRPEIVIPWGQDAPEREAEELSDGTLALGRPVRCIRAPHFGRIGKVAALPIELTKVESETRVRVLEVEFQEGVRALVPRANVELISG